MNEENCTLCNAFDTMTYLLTKGYDLKESFHTVVEDLLTDSQVDSFDDGFVSALQMINKSTEDTINNILIDKCDCEECNNSCN